MDKQLCQLLLPPLPSVASRALLLVSGFGVMACWAALYAHMYRSFRPGEVASSSYVIEFRLLRATRKVVSVDTPVLYYSSKGTIVQVIWMRVWYFVRVHVYHQLLERQLPKLHRHLDDLQLTSVLFSSQWFMALFAQTLPLPPPPTPGDIAQQRETSKQQTVGAISVANESQRNTLAHSWDLLFSPR